MGWKIGGGVLSALAAVALLVKLTTPAEYLTGIELPIVVVFAVLAAVFFWKGAKAGKRKKAAAKDAARAYMSDQDLQTIQAGGLPSLAGVPVVLGDGETACFFAPARRYITKKKAVGRTGSHGGVSVRVAKGVSVRSGGGASQTVYDDVTDAFPGQVVLTNRRVVFLATQNGFECGLDTISAIAPEGGRVLIQAGAKTYRLAVADQGSFTKALDLAVRK